LRKERRVEFLSGLLLLLKVKMFAPCTDFPCLPLSTRHLPLRAIRLRPQGRAAACKALGWSAICLLSVLVAPATEDFCSPLQSPLAIAHQSQTQLLHQAQALMDHKDYPGAARIYVRILRTDPNSFPALSNLGVANAQMGNYKTAAKMYDRALRLHHTLLY